MSGFSRDEAVDRLEAVVETVENDLTPVPVHEVWAFGDIALGLDPVDRLDIYLTKDVLVRDSPKGESTAEDEYDIDGVGKSVRAEWAERYPEHLRANRNGHAAPEKCLAAQLLPEDEPVHLEVCNTSFEDNVTQRLRGAKLREDYTQLLDPRGVCLWVDGTTSEEAFRKLREGDLALPTLSGALEMLGMDETEADEAAHTVHEWRSTQDGVTIRGDVV